MNTLLSSIHAYIQDHALIKAGQTVIVGLSGGPDSVFLLHCLKAYQEQIPFTLVAAHLNHGWRAESDADAEFCQTLTAQLSIPFYQEQLKDLPTSFRYNGSQEEIGRKARRFFFESLAKKVGADRIALGHHSDDQIETFFMRLMRGASLVGLGGMKPIDGYYIRPLLAIKKADIIAYLEANDITHVIDRSNSSPFYLRNRIRNTLIPILDTIDNRSSVKIIEAVSSLQETENFLHSIEQRAVVDCIHKANTLNLSAFYAQEPYIQKRIILQWLIHGKVTFTPSKGLIDEVLRFLYGTSSNTHTISTTRIIKKQGYAYLYTSTP